MLDDPEPIGCLVTGARRVSGRPVGSSSSAKPLAIRPEGGVTRVRAALGHVVGAIAA
jgi:hypothetical protein